MNTVSTVPYIFVHTCRSAPLRSSLLPTLCLKLLQQPLGMLLQRTLYL